MNKHSLNPERKILINKIKMEEIRKWYNKAYGEMVVGIDISDEQDICDILWYYEQSRNEIKK